MTPAYAASAHIALVGMPGSGKSATAEALAASTGLRLRDVDAVVAEATGRTPAEIIRSDGEAAFRAIEADMLEAVLDGEPAVVSCGAGAVVTPRCRTLLRRLDVVTVWLTVLAATAAARLASSGQDRPLLDVPGAYDRLWHERRRHYLSVAAMVVATDARTPAEVARVISARLAHGRTGAPA